MYTCVYLEYFSPNPMNAHACKIASLTFNLHAHLHPQAFSWKNCQQTIAHSLTPLPTHTNLQQHWKTEAAWQDTQEKTCTLLPALPPSCFPLSRRASWSFSQAVVCPSVKPDSSRADASSSLSSLSSSSSFCLQRQFSGRGRSLSLNFRATSWADSREGDL